MDNLVSRLIKLEENSKAEPGEAMAQASRSKHDWGDLPCVPASQPSSSPSPPTSALRVYTHWDRIADATVLKVNSNQNKIALAAVGDAFKDIFRHYQCVTR